MTTPPAAPTPGSQPPTGPTTPTTSGRPTPAPGTATPQANPAGSPLDTLLKGASDAAQQARAQVARAAESNRGRIAATVDRLGATIDQRTGSRYHQHVAKVKSWVESGVDAVAGTAHAPGAAAPHGTAQPPVTSSGPAPSTSATPATSSGPAAAPAAPTTPVPPAKPAEGWHRGPDGEWVRS